VQFKDVEEELRTAAVTLTRIDASGGAVGPAVAARMYPDGAFFFVNVDTGRYMLRASGQPLDDKKSLFGSQEVSVDTNPIAASGLTSLRIILDQPNPPTPAPAPTTSGSQGSFSAPGVPPLPDATKPPESLR
jgi:hypothetical protein